MMRCLLLLLLLGLSAAAAANEPKPVSTYLSDRSCCGHARLPPNMVPHSGVDFSGKFGDDVIAPADGMAMAHRGADPASCGNTIVIHHGKFDRYTIYCHFQELKVKPGDIVKRGQVIGTLGDSGVASNCRRSVGACPIVHLELSTQSRSYPAAQPGITFNAMDYMAGCFDPQKTYPDDKLVLTYPVRCKN